MARKKDDLTEVVNSLMTISEASEWINIHREELALTRPINEDTLKKSCQKGRLKAVLKGRNYLTREQELREYLKNFDPKNKTERTPIKERAIKRRALKAKLEATL